MLIRDGGGGGSTPQVTSDVTVDPGAIQAYARFLAEMNTEVKQLRTAVARLEQIEPASFGAYSASAGAHRRTNRTVVDERAFLTQVVTRLGQLTDDTRELARDYTDLDELNAVSGQSITTHLNAPEA